LHADRLVRAKLGEDRLVRRSFEKTGFLLPKSRLTIKQLYGILIPLACNIMTIALDYIGIQPVIVHNLKFSLTSISKREFLSFAAMTLALFMVAGIINYRFESHNISDFKALLQWLHLQWLHFQ